MKFLFGILISALLAGCSSMATRTPSSENWQNRLTCDDGVRIDATTYLAWQIVLFGDAARHFADAGAFSSQDLNPAGEYVRALQPEGDHMFVSRLKNGELAMDPNFDRRNPNYEVRWVPYENSGNGGTNYLFHHCH